MMGIEFDFFNRDPIAYESAVRHEDNIINKIGWVPATQELYKCLCYPPQRRGIAELTSLHLSLNGDSHRNFRCIVPKPITWIRGSLSVYLPIHEEDEVGKTVRKVLDCAKVLMRCPMAHKSRPLYIRWVTAIRQYIAALLRRPIPSQYVQHPSNHFRKTGYTLLDYVEPATGQMLSHDGTISLTNRPLRCGMAILENDGAPRVMHRNDTYTCVEPYVSDMLTFHDGQGCRYQMAVRALLRAICFRYEDRDLRHSPFVIQFTDLHASNILWNITSVIDLEWICAQPPEMLDLPYWIAGQGIDEVGDGENLETYVKTREELIQLPEDEERKLALDREFSVPVPVSKIMRRAWSCKASWFTHCLDSDNGMYAPFDQHLRPKFIPFYLTEKMEALISKFWREGAHGVVAQKLKETEDYVQTLRKLFGKDMEIPNGKEILASCGSPEE
ncbi:hypothetical protein QBC33DRAFT_575755 [Phialemonium atrogriseum]|uniref:Aminoglycoside phosphotransferase domain-containing protein n=1 Tax=Phialemonium atrogriseum TaxID=1093897 RepID=A0AAJ0C8E0_9PEZI|nr:uncharacterized protein QBC33DRAFT_575755 [Phialemonium atrogriseum]KAK1772055.1 hypothetical protein QBC33DRAFT_575755 [Phialemonium atrogriseum]